jgi:hypothetical protein
MLYIAALVYQLAYECLINLRVARPGIAFAIGTLATKSDTLTAETGISAYSSTLLGSDVDID